MCIWDLLLSEGFSVQLWGVLDEARLSINSKFIWAFILRVEG